MTPNTDIVIAVRGTRDYPIEKDFENCIDSLVQHTSNFRLLLVDDNSDAQGADVVARVAAQFPGSILVRSHFQRWFTKAYNLGLRLVRTERVVTLNADTVLGAGWLEELYEVWSEAEAQLGRVGLVGSVLSSDEPRRWANSIQADYVTGHCWLLSMSALYEASASRGQPGIYLDETSALNIHIRSDVELCWRLNQLNWATIKSFKSAVGHIGGRSWGHDLWKVQALRLEDVAERYK